jgi:hypothetical protein
MCVINKRRPSGYMTAYRCKFCNCFHFGHPPKRIREAIIARRKLVSV